MFGTAAPPAGGYNPGSPPANNGATPLWSVGNPASEYDYSVSFNVTSDASGVITAFAWSDPGDFSGQTATILNGIAVGAVPEPSTLGMLALAAVGLTRRRRA